VAKSDSIRERSQAPKLTIPFGAADDSKSVWWGDEELTEFAAEIREFLIESHENLVALDRQIVELEKTPGDEPRIASIFRIVHTLKGTSEFFGFRVIGSISHILESLLGQVRGRSRPLTPALTSLILEAVDALKQQLQFIELNKREGEEQFQLLRERLSAAYQEGGTGMQSARRRLSPAEPDPQGAIEKLGTPTRRASDRSKGPVMKSAVDAEGSGSAIDRFNGTRATDRAANATIRVDVELLDRLLGLVDDLAAVPAERLHFVIDELRECVMLARMQPIGVIWNKLPRAVRDVAVEMGKMIEVEMDGALIELDRTIIEAISDPLTHMVRNACDHGIEFPQVRIANGKSPQGTIQLRAFNEAGQVHIEVSDDGAGIDPEKIKAMALRKGLIQPAQADSMPNVEALRLIFLPGFSTSDAVTSISGRGVGMDVVKTNIERINGTVDLFSHAGMGTTVAITIPPRLTCQGD